MYYLLILAVGVERLVELVVSKRNARWAFGRGGREFGREHYPVMVALHVGLLVGCVIATAGAVAANLTIGVWFWYGSTDVIMPLILPAVLPFNLIKTVLNSALTLLVYKAVSNLITPKKDQVKGR